jgi:N-acetylglucosaminyldiphosphoundecaprenol N-acetyl-beta-D-mannosaminyltransferase
MGKIELFGCPVDSLNLANTIKTIEHFILERKPRRHSALNAAKIVRMRNDERLREIVASSDLVSADGQSVVWASRLLGKPLPERVTGIDLMQKLLQLAQDRGHRVYLLGATQEVVTRLKDELKRQRPGLKLVGWRNGYFSSREEENIVGEINARAPDILFVGMSTPKKEYFLGKYQGRLKVPFCMGVGGSFDVLCGKTKRAPRLMRKMGLEWFYRFLREPTRLWKRYLVTNLLFLLYLLGEKLRNGGGGKSAELNPYDDGEDMMSIDLMQDGFSPHCQANSENAENIKEIPAQRHP